MLTRDRPKVRTKRRAEPEVGVVLDARPGGFSVRGIAIRLFVTCWIIYVLHFATNIVREIFPALSIGDHLSFRTDEYAGMHVDMFEKPGYGWHIGNNPGVSMLAAIPYALCRPVIDPIVAHVNRKRAEAALTEPPEFGSPWPMAREFYAKAWKKGYDVKFGLAAFVMQSLCMAPSSALAAVVMFYLLRRVFGSDRLALWLALLYAFGTPVFFRTGYLNQNLMLGHIAFCGFLALWNPDERLSLTPRTRFLLAGLAGGIALLFDYSGVVLLLGLFAYGIVKRLSQAGFGDAFRHGCWYVLGSLPPVLLLWFYQWKSFGHPFYPGQHWMPPVDWSDLGYQGYGLPQLDLLWKLAFDHHFGLFVSCPLFLLALAAPWVNGGNRRALPAFELTALLVLFVAFWLFFSGSNYVRLQLNTGIRYMSAMFPFLFVPAALVLARLPRIAAGTLVLVCFTLSWCLAMHREVEHAWGILEPVFHVFFGGFKLPLLTTLARTGEAFGPYFRNGASPLPLFALTAGVLYLVWSPRIWRRSAAMERGA